MPKHLEFVVPGPPISNQVPGPNLNAWKATISGAAADGWTGETLAGEVKAIVINFYDGSKPSLDVDNMSKAIFDEMQAIIYDDDRQIVQAELTHVKIDAAFTIKNASKILVDALQQGNEFVYVRIEDPVYPFPLPT